MSKRYPDKYAARGRLSQPDRIPIEDIPDILEWRNEVNPGDLERIRADLAMHHIDAVREFDSASRTLTKWLIGLTGALVVLTVALVYFTVQLSHPPKAREQSEPARTTIGRPFL